MDANLAVHRCKTGQAEDKKFKEGGRSHESQRVPFRSYGGLSEVNANCMHDFACHSLGRGNPGILDAGSSPARHGKRQYRFLSATVPSSLTRGFQLYYFQFRTHSDRTFENSYIIYAGLDFPEDLEQYSLVVHCGACMINRTEMVRRIRECKRRGVPITNYGIAISKVQGVLNRVIAFFFTVSRERAQ